MQVGALLQACRIPAVQCASCSCAYVPVRACPYALQQPARKAACALPGGVDYIAQWQAYYAQWYGWAPPPAFSWPTAQNFAPSTPQAPVLARTFYETGLYLQDACKHGACNVF